MIAPPTRIDPPIVLNASSFDGGCNTTFDWTRKEKQRMDGTDTEGRRSERQ
ncbi:hypothetical protein DPMN_033864 [Dreissena polymorpha]|uniref:Uncharacterized protein n=1 Tax=Dreissena polymorpha TaxID=45954 RepID=A0A9D4RJJ0_DREPO|nr:hypothetical protein DPMN_087631 [Dreissena polymorpha]KAH3870674.1 hypothetical protein DPMN_033864 [Dreissena polymorpha]